MEAPEVPLEEVHEHLQHHAHHDQDKFVSRVALSTAIFAAIAAIASLLAGDHANEAMVSQIESADKWAYYQAKGIKSAVLNTKIAILESEGKKAEAKDEEKLAEYAKEQEDIKKEAETKEKEAADHLTRHKLLAAGVTMLQISIAVGAISALTKRKAFWGVSLCFGLLGLAFLLRELIFTLRPG